MKKVKRQKTAYSERSDLHKIKSNWNKTRGLYNRGEWSATIIRAATAVEIAANLVVRKELEDSRGIDRQFVNSLLKWSNGVKGKFEQLILPLFRESPKLADIRRSYKDSKQINDKRNAIVHSGEFSSKNTAKKIAKLSKKIIESLVKQYKDDFQLEDIE